MEIAGHAIVDVLGAGAMGVVYKAVHPRLNRNVALKVLPSSLAANPAYRDAFNQEAELASKLVHPNIVRILDCSPPDDRTLWLSMELVGGGDVKALLSGSPSGLPLDQVVRLITDIGHGLDYAQANGVLHRDVKPANLLLEYDPRYGERALLADFGIARASDSTLTSVGWTVPYVAPERLNNQRSDHRADIYSLGCTLFQLLTGRPPFNFADEDQVKEAHRRSRPPSVCLLRPDLPGHLESVIAKVLAKDPEDRYGSCAALATDLARAATATTFNPASARCPVATTPARIDFLASPTFDAAPTPTGFNPAPTPAPRHETFHLICLLIDVGPGISEATIAAINSGLTLLAERILADTRLGEIVQLAVVTFSGHANIEKSMSKLQIGGMPQISTHGSGRSFANGLTVAEAAIRDGVRELGIEAKFHHRPTVYCLVAGEDDGQIDWKPAWHRLTGESENAAEVISIGFGHVERSTVISLATRPEYSFVSSSPHGDISAIAEIFENISSDVADIF